MFVVLASVVERWANSILWINIIIEDNNNYYYKNQNFLTCPVNRMVFK